MFNVCVAPIVIYLFPKDVLNEMVNSFAPKITESNSFAMLLKYVLFNIDVVILSEECRLNVLCASISSFPQI